MAQLNRVDKRTSGPGKSFVPESMVRFVGRFLQLLNDQFYSRYLISSPDVK